MRQPMPEQGPKDRIKNFNEVALGYTKEQAIKDGRARGGPARLGFREDIRPSDHPDSQAAGRVRWRGVCRGWPGHQQRERRGLR